MHLPPLTDAELRPFLEDGLWVAKLATKNVDGSIRITPLTYGVDDDCVVFSTWQESDAVRNVRRDGTASVLIDRPERPYAGVHYTGRAVVLSDVGAEDYGRWFQRYIGSYDQTVESYHFLVGLGIGERAFIRFQPAKRVSWDFAKVPGA